jgi:hypothetical protein
LLGEISEEGFWYYFPITSAVKTPLPILILLLATLRMALSDRKLRDDERFLLIPLILFFAMGVYSRMNIGLRHILAIYRFLYVWLGGAAPTIWDSRTYWKRSVVVRLGLIGYSDQTSHQSGAKLPGVGAKRRWSFFHSLRPD